MASPKHLWSGDWERDSAAARAPRADPGAAAEPPGPPEPPAPPEPPTRWRPHRGVLGLAALLAVAIIATALAIGLSGGRPQPTVTLTGVGGTGTGATTPTVTTPFGQTGTSPTTPTSTAPGASPVPPTSTSPTGTTGTSTAPGTTTGTTTTPGAATLGLVLQSLPDNRVSVQAVVPGSPAAQAGIGAGDLLLSINGRAVSSPGQVYSILHRLAKGSTVTMHLIQGSTSLTAQIQASGYP